MPPEKLRIFSAPSNCSQETADQATRAKRGIGAPRLTDGDNAMEMVAAARANLFGLDRCKLRDEFARLAEPPYRAEQVMQWIYRRGVRDFALMTNLGRDLRARLSQAFLVQIPKLLTEQISSDGTRKWVLQLQARAGKPGAAIETVYIPERGRGTLCISSQAGCAMDCAFCSTARGGFSHNMSTAEIIAQVWFAEKALGGNFGGERMISNVVFMGMGEPLANYANVLPALRILLDDYGFGLSKRRVTVSTAGLVPFIDRLSTDVDTALAISLHAANDALRDVLVPINRKYPIAELMAACRRYVDGKDRKAHVVFEYVMLDQVNDQPGHAHELACLLRGFPGKVNLIPFNPFSKAAYRCTPEDGIRRFADTLRGKGIVTMVRRTRGQDIDAACGQLVGEVISRQTNRIGQRSVAT